MRPAPSLAVKALAMKKLIAVIVVILLLVTAGLVWRHVRGRVS